MCSLTCLRTEVCSVFLMIPANICANYFSAALVSATSETVTVTTTVTECAASCYSTTYICTNTNSYTEFPTFSFTSTPFTEQPSTTTWDTSSVVPSSSNIGTYTTTQDTCTDLYTCSGNGPIPPGYTTPGVPESSELPVTTECGPPSYGSVTGSTNDACWPSEGTTSDGSAPTSSPPSDTTSDTYVAPTITSNIPVSSETTYSTDIPQPTSTEDFPGITLPWSSSFDPYPIPTESYETSADGIVTSQQSTPTTFVTNTRGRSSSDDYLSSTEDLPPAYETSTSETGDPPSYTDLPSYGGNAKFGDV